ncbi:MAG: glycosyltransferase family 39 protein [Candidatus Omnitrophota bacterium]
MALLIKVNDFMDKNKLNKLFTNKYFILFSILFIGIFLRLYNLTGKSIWYDEACSLNQAAYSWNDIFFHNDINHPLPKPVYFILLKSWAVLSGYNEFSVRLLSVIFGVISIFAIYKLGKIMFGEKTGLISAFLIAISPYNIYYSQQARYYTLFLILSLTSMFFFIKIITGKESKRILYFWYTLANILIFYTFQVGIYILIIQYFIFLMFKKKIVNKADWLKTQKILFAFLLPILYFYVAFIIFNVGNYNDSHLKFNPSGPNLNSLIETIEVFSYGGPTQAHAGVGFRIADERLIAPRILAVLFCFLFILSFFYYRRIKNTASEVGLSYKDRIIFLWLWLFLSISGLYLFSNLIRPMYLTRYLIGIAPSFYIIIAGVLAKMSKVKCRILIVTIIFFSVFSLNVLYFPGPDRDWRKAARYINALIKNNDILVLAPVMQILPFWYYYKYKKGLNKYFANNIDRYGEKFYNKANFQIIDGSNPVIGGDTEYIIRILSEPKYKYNDIWLIISPDWLGRDSTDRLKNYLGRIRVSGESKYFNYDGVEFVRYLSAGYATN